MSQQKYTGAALASKVAAQEFSEDFADILTCYPKEKTNNALLGYFATTHRGDQPIEYAELCAAFIDLVDRGVLKPEFRSDLADEQMAELRKRFAPQTIAAVPSATATPPAPPPDPIAECVSDYRTLDGSSFKRKWMSLPDRRHVYETAIAAGRI
jgi:hypothetical protein